MLSLPLPVYKPLPRLQEGFDGRLKERRIFACSYTTHAYYSLLSSCPLFLRYSEQNDLFLSCKYKKCFRGLSVERERKKGWAGIPSLSLYSSSLQMREPTFFCYHFSPPINVTFKTVLNISAGFI